MTSPAPTPPDDAGPPADTGVSRRLLLGGGLLALGAVGGGVAGFVTTDPPREVVPDPVPPADVLAAIARERELVATYDAALVGTPTPLWSHLRDEHQQHAAALEALLPSGVSASPGTSSPTGAATAPSDAPTTAPPVAADLLAAEQRAADAARAACLAGNGTAVVLLACIAASEASHAAVLA